ncbi:MAG: hypothetical protein A2033_17730 [Bacteroidetes bacterium GWA2_31_9]|nr:MAG: hypothetical protein A2033_17730 [Bacteroidetes bacterium GWA2_31_9]
MHQAEETELVNRCLKNDVEAQNKLYKTYARKMYAVSWRFARVGAEADDILQEGFIKVFTKLNTYRHEGSLEGWIRRIIVNTALTYIKKHGEYKQEIDIENIGNCDIVEDEAIANLSKEDILKLVQELPDGKRMVFNLYVYEGYSHKEIGEMLNINEGTSKGQLSKAKQILKEKLEKINIKLYERVY